jgi:hypothetical protein
MNIGDIASPDSSRQTLLGRARLIVIYTLALIVYSVGAGFLWGVIRLLFHLPEYKGGGIDGDLYGRLVCTVLVGALLYRHLARKHTASYLVLGMCVASIAGLVSGVLEVCLGGPVRLWLFAVSLAFHIGLMLLSGLVFGAFSESPND